MGTVDVNFSFAGRSTRQFKRARRYVIKKPMEKIDAQRDHRRLERFKPGAEVTFKGKPYKIQLCTTLASGEPAVVLEGEKEQFVISADRFLAGGK